MSLVEEDTKVNVAGRHLRWILRGLASVLAVAGAAAWSQPYVAGSDLWWHLASGRQIVAEARVPPVDSFSYTFAGEAWTNHEWLWDVVYWSAYRITPDAVAWLNLAIVVGAFALVFAAGRRLSGSSLATGLALWAAAASTFWFVDIRPHLITLLFVGIVLATRHREWARWLWPPLVVLWVNLHGGFVFGIGVIGLHVLVKTLERSWSERRAVIPVGDWISVALCLLAILANPSGWRILEYPAAYLDAGSPFRQLIEWRSPEFDLELAGYEGRFWWMVVLATAGLPFAARRDRFFVALIAVTFSMAATSRRFIPLFDLTATPVAALSLAAAIDVGRRRWPLVTRPLASAATAGAAAVIVALLWQDVRLTPHFLERWTQATYYPEAAVRYLRAVGSPKRLLNYYNWGGYVMLHAPEMKVFIDGRANTLYGERFYVGYERLLDGYGARAVLHRYPADAALLPAWAPLIAELQRDGVGWKPIYRDRMAVILAPPGSPILAKTRPQPSEILAGHAEVLLARGLLAERQGDRAGAVRLWHATIEANPLLLEPYEHIALTLAKEGNAEGVERIVSEALRAQPRALARIRRTESIAYEVLGDLPNAVRAMRSGINRGPFGINRGGSKRLAKLEAELERRAASNDGRGGGDGRQ